MSEYQLKVSVFEGVGGSIWSKISGRRRCSTPTSGKNCFISVSDEVTCKIILQYRRLAIFTRGIVDGRSTNAETF